MQLCRQERGSQESLGPCELMQRRNKNVAAVAMANKMVRTVYALLKNEEDYHVGEMMDAE